MRRVLITRCRGKQRVASRRYAMGLPLSQREGTHAAHPAPRRRRRGSAHPLSGPGAHGLGRTGRRPPTDPSPAARRRLARRPAHRRAGPQRPVRLRRLRPDHRRRPSASTRSAARTPGVADDRATRVADHVDSYTTGVDYGSGRRVAGATAKALHLAQVAGQDPTAFGGVDLVARLEGLTTDTGRSAGRIARTRATYGDYANTIGQAFAASGAARRRLDRGDGRHGVPARPAVRRRLVPAAVHRRRPPPTRPATAASPRGQHGRPGRHLARGDPARRPGRRPDVDSGAREGRGRGCSTQQDDDGSFGGGTSTEAPTATAPGWPAGRSASAATPPRPRAPRSGCAACRPPTSRRARPP